MSDFNSQKRFTEISKLANLYYERSDKIFIEYNEKTINEIEEKYSGRLSILKEEIYGDAIGQKIDRHKIIALYIQMFLENPLFTVLQGRENLYPSPSTLLINEYFCLDIAIIILTRWNEAALDINKFSKYKIHFLKLLAYYKGYSELHKRNLAFTYALAHIIHFIELNYL
ncbi:MAG: hypothetical protein LBH98_06270 [Chitinispirillales bacterium]|jgi:hypothetical protein|nr:hypothetical protein [Chitinispirillales bacterium]